MPRGYKPGYVAAVLSDSEEQSYVRPSVIYLSGLPAGDERATHICRFT